MNMQHLMQEMRVKISLMDKDRFDKFVKEMRTMYDATHKKRFEKVYQVSYARRDDLHEEILRTFSSKDKAEAFEELIMTTDPPKNHGFQCVVIREYEVG